MTKDLSLKLVAILLALSLPIVIVSVYGWGFTSFSKLWETPLAPLFIISNAITSYFLFQVKKWELPSLFLLLVTAFDTTNYSEAHNLFAVFFFISCIYPLWSRKLFLYLYLGSLSLAIFGLLYLEWGMTWVICGVHLNALYILWKFENRNKL